MKFRIVLAVVLGALLLLFSVWGYFFLRTGATKYKVSIDGLKRHFTEYGPGVSSLGETKLSDLCNANKLIESVFVENSKGGQTKFFGEKLRGVRISLGGTVVVMGANGLVVEKNYDLFYKGESYSLIIQFWPE